MFWIELARYKEGMRIKVQTNIWKKSEWVQRNRKKKEIMTESSWLDPQKEKGSELKNKRQCIKWAGESKNGYKNVMEQNREWSCCKLNIAIFPFFLIWHFTFLCFMFLKSFSALCKILPTLKRNRVMGVGVMRGIFL